MDECLFVPIVRRKSEWMLSRPIVPIAADRLYIRILTAFAIRPDAQNPDAVSRGDRKRLGHPVAILVAIHDGYVGTDESEGLAVKQKTGAVRSDKPGWGVSCRSA